MLRKSDESAFSIVPSHMSSRLSSIHSDPSRISTGSAELVYRQLTVDNDLFTARVYKRNYRHPAMNFRMKTRASTSVQMRERPSTGNVATETLDYPVQRASPENQSMISLDRGEESTSQPPHSTRATLLKTFDRVQIPSSLWITGPPISTTRQNTVVGPAVSIDLVYVYMDRDPEQSRNLADSVSQCQPGHLVHLLRLLAGEFLTWRKRFLGEACNQQKLDQVELLLFVDQGLREWLMPAGPWHLDDSLQSNHLDNVASQLLLTGLGKDALTEAFARVHPSVRAVARAHHENVYSEEKFWEANTRLPYELPAEHTLLLAAAYKRDWDSIDVLLKDGVDVNAKFEDGKTCLLRMASMANPKDHYKFMLYPYSVEAVMSSLLNLGADIEATTLEGDNFLHLLARRKIEPLAPDFHTGRFDKAPIFSALSAVNQRGETPAVVAEQVGNDHFLNCVDELHQMEALGLARWRNGFWIRL